MSASEIMSYILPASYLIGSVTFILGLKMLGHPDTARRGNLIAAAGMFIAILGTIFFHPEVIRNYVWIFSGIALGALVGTYAARKVQMTQMPEMVSLFNGMGGACAALIGLVESTKTTESDTVRMLTIIVGLVIGSISFAGSVIAWGKLNGRIKDVTFGGQQFLNLSLLTIILLDVILLAAGVLPINTFIYVELALCLVYGVLFVLPIGGADMPVVISLLNSFTGVAAACGGFLYDNKVMLTGGILVGSAGTILTILMCKAMNRSLLNVVIGSFGASANETGIATEAKDQGPIKEVSLSDAAMMMSYAKKVMIVPGYGLAVAQAQHTCHELEMALEEKGVEVKYAIHPVAGRMPGHMNVLLAEADVEYPKLLEMEEANSEFNSADVVMVLGANDVVNPAAKTDKSSPIYGMPVLEVENAKTVIVNKRSMKPGYAGIDNDLFYQPKTSMLFGDAKKVLQQLITEIKAN
ncbi:MAG: NAD(P)(+) transhydrogenase (Re/Si-specific) subunit beta [Chitinophagales bacterium]